MVCGICGIFFTFSFFIEWRRSLTPAREMGWAAVCQMTVNNDVQVRFINMLHKTTVATSKWIQKI